MKVRVTFDFDEQDRLAVAHRFGQSEPYSREDIASFVEGIFWTTMEDVRYEYRNDRSRPEDDDDR